MAAVAPVKVSPLIKVCIGLENFLVVGRYVVILILDNSNFNYINNFVYPQLCFLVKNNELRPRFSHYKDR